MALKMVSCTFAAIGLMLLPAALASDDCLGGLMNLTSSGCAPAEGGDFDVAKTCSEECESAFKNAWPAECNEQQFPGENMSYGQALEQIEMLCEPCMKGYMQLSMECNGDGKMCMPDCTDLLSQTTADCAQSNAALPTGEGDSMMKISDMLPAFSMQASQCSSSPAPPPNNGSADCWGGLMMITSSGCAPGDGEDFDLAKTCSEECESTFKNAWPAECIEQQMPGENISYGQALEQIEMLCEPCMKGFMQLSAECSGEGGMCRPSCTYLLSQATAVCAQSDTTFPTGDDGSMMKISDFLALYSLQASQCSPSPAPAPTPGSAGCVKISNAMAEKWSAKSCNK